MKKILFILILSFSLLFPELVQAEVKTQGCQLYTNFREEMAKNHLELDKFFLDRDEVKYELYSKAEGNTWILVVVGFDPIRRPIACLVGQGDFIMSGRTKSF